LPHQDDHSDAPSTLPLPDLNPLLNPLLGQNMGRWAEVYFTSAPEKREQAVLDLLRELQAENSANAAALPVSEPTSRPGAEPAAQIAEGRAALVRCHACGRENPASHLFCGMCGTAVSGPGAASDLYVSDVPVPDFGVAEFNGADLPTEELEDQDIGYTPQREPAPLVPNNVASSVASDVAHDVANDEHSNEHRDKSQFVASEDAFSEPALRRHESLQPPRGRDDTYQVDHMRGFLDPAPASSPYRTYLVTALICVLVALGYMIWRSMHASDSAHVAPQAPPAVTTQPSAADSATSSPTSPGSATDTSNPGSTASKRAKVPSHVAADESSHAASAKTDAASRAESAGLIPGKNSQAESLAGNGGEELAMAQRYLNGTAGQGRDSAEAAKWLWKAIAKHNGEAMLLLSELYLKGDGVAKNCDQARVLLDAAAIREVKGAAERLRNLQAFGCS
jgi:hypothetical protein